MPGARSMVRYLRSRGALPGSWLVLLCAALCCSVRACSDDDQALKAALIAPGRERDRAPCRVPMCRHRCSAAAAEGLCEADRGADAVRAACPASCGMCGEMADEDLSHLDIGSRCDVARVADASTMSAAEFLQHYVRPQRPVVLGGLLDHWPARRWAGVESNGARSRPTAAQWSAANAESLEEVGRERGTERQRQSRGQEFFRTELGRSRRLGKNQYLNLDYTPKDLPTRQKLHAGYTVPSIFKGDILQSACHSSLPHRWLMLSAEGSGSQWHIDPYNASAWNGLLLGRKRWALLPPTVRTPAGLPPPPAGYDHPDDAGYFDYWDPARNRGGWWGITQPHERPDVSARAYFESILPQVSGGPAPLECTLHAGELIYIPQGWWHTVLNLEPTIAYTETYVAAADTSATGAAAQSIGELMKRPAHSWEDGGHTVPTMPARCLAELRAAFPQLFGGAERKREAEQVCAADKTEAPRDLKAVAIEEVWGRPKGERTVASALGRHKRGLPLLIQGSLAERWAMMSLWNSSYLFEAWDEGIMPSLRGIHGRSKARGSDFVICKGNAPLAKHITVTECNGDGMAPLHNVFEPPLDPSEMYWDDGVLKGGGFKGTNSELRVWRGPVSELGMTLRSHVGVHAGKIVDDIAVTQWTDLLLFEYHKVHDTSKGMGQIQALRKNHNDDHEALFEKLHGKYGQDPLELWEQHEAAPFLSQAAGGKSASAYAGMDATFINAGGVALRTVQLLDHASILQVSGSRALTLFRPQDSRALCSYPSTHPAHPHSQITNISMIYGPQDHPGAMFGSAVKPWRLTLHPGDVLHVPALWWVHERAVTESIGITIWTRDERRRSTESELSGLPIPLESGWSEQSKLRAFGMYLASVALKVAPAPKAVAAGEVEEIPVARARRTQRWVEGFLVSRYSGPLAEQLRAAASAPAPGPRPWDGCASEWPLPEGESEGELREKFGEAAAKVTEALGSLRRDRPTAAEMVSEDYFETLVGFVVGPLELPGFFEHCVIEALPAEAKAER